jgi:hypothetical protein
MFLPSLMHVQQWLPDPGTSLYAGKVTHGIGTIVKVLIGFGVLLGVVVAVVVMSLFRKK